MSADTSSTPKPAIHVCGDVFQTQLVYRRPNNGGLVGRSHSEYLSSMSVLPTGACLIQTLLEACQSALGSGGRYAILGPNPVFSSEHSPGSRHYNARLVQELFKEASIGMDRLVVTETDYQASDTQEKRRLRIYLSLGLTVLPKHEPGDTSQNQPKPHQGLTGTEIKPSDDASKETPKSRKDLTWQNCADHDQIVRLFDLSALGFAEDKNPAVDLGPGTSFQPRVSLKSAMADSAKSTPQREPWTILKLKNRRPEAQFDPDITEAVEALLKARAERTLVVLNIQDLRHADICISHEVSWERTVQQIILCLEEVCNSTSDSHVSPLWFLKEAKHFIVTIAPEAVVYFCREVDEWTSYVSGDLRPGDEGRLRHAINVVRKKLLDEAAGKDDREDVAELLNVCRMNQLSDSALLIYLPTEIEGDLLRRHPGRMRGFDSIIAASLAHHLMQSALYHLDCPPLVDPSSSGEDLQPGPFHFPFEAIVTGLILGLKAGRILQIHGYDCLEMEVSKRKALGELLAPWIGTAVRQMRYYNVENSDNGAAADNDANSDSESNLDQPLYPFDLLAQIIACGEIQIPIWKLGGAAVPSQLRSHLMELSDRYRTEWEDAGWLQQHRIHPRVINEFIADAKSNHQKGVEHRNTHWDASYWSLKDSTFRGASDLRGNGVEHVATQLGYQLLVHGPDWLFSKKHKDRRTEMLLRRLADRVYKHCSGKTSEMRRWLDGTYTTDILPVFPALRLGDLYLLDRQEIEGYRIVSGIISEYIEGNPRRPLSIGVFGPPGSGKSFGVQSIVKTLERPTVEFKELTFNLSQLSDGKDLEACFRDIQHWSLRGKTPVVFWDEFDTPIGGKPLAWLPYFLAPMNDAQAQIRHEIIPLPASIFVFAGSMFHSYAEFEHLYNRAEGIPADGSVRNNNIEPEDWLASKGSDFKSRLTGTLDILGIDPPATPSTNRADSEYGYVIRRALILRNSLWKRHHSRLFGPDGKLEIEDNVAKAFLRTRRYHHGARSIDRIVEASRIGRSQRYDVSCLPPSSILRLHTDAVAFEDLYQAYPVPFKKEF